MEDPVEFFHPLREEGAEGGGTGLIGTAVDHVQAILVVAFTHRR
jgi:hypothetical protein